VPPIAAPGPAAPVSRTHVLQLFADGISAGVPSAHETAALGVTGTPGALPHQAQIQRAFGRHDVSGIRAHTGDAAEASTRALGARGFATGNDVVLSRDSDLHTVAHEAAHVVQQRSGLSLPGGMGSAGDAHEQHADRVAERVVAGSSAEDLLDGYGPAAGGGAAVQRRGIQFVLRTGHDSAASIAIVRGVLGGDNVSAMNALLHACDQVATRRGPVTPAPTLEHVVCVGGGDSFDLRLSSHDLDTLRAELRTRIASLEGAAAISTEIGPFAQDFNTRFAPILGSLRRSETRDDRAASDAPAADGYTTAELDIRFTAHQRELLDGFLHGNRIPERMFGGDELGTMTAPQRILIAAHILTSGEYQPGSFAQRLHARMCGDWARLVNTYAGVVEDRGTGVEHQFDHDGDLALAGGHMTTEYAGEREALSPEGATGHRLFQQRGMSMSTFEAIVPGDWIYIFTHTDTAGGNHSVVFGSWEGGEMTDERGHRYRSAILYGQSAPSEGGSATTYRLGEEYWAREGSVPTIYPITQVHHYDIDTRPPETVDDIREHELGIDPDVTEVVPTGAIPELGTGADAEANFTLIRGVERRLHGRLDLAALRHVIRDRNEAYLQQLASRATEGQLFLLRATNERDDFDTLIRLNERLAHMVHNAEGLAAAEEAASDRIDPVHDARAAEIEAETTALEAEIEAVNPDLDRARDLLEHDVRLRSIEREVSRTERWQRHARTALRATPARNRTRRAQLEARIAAYEGRLEKLRIALTGATAARDAAAEVEETGRETEHLGRIRSSRQLVALLEARQARLREEIDDLEASAGYHTAHPGSADVYHGTSDGHREARLTGQLSAVTPALDWSVLVHAGEPPITEGAASPRAPRRGRRHGRGT
jgi:hypothetical protein